MWGTGGSDEKRFACDTFHNLTLTARLILELTPGESIMYAVHITIVVIASLFSALPLGVYCNNRVNQPNSLRAYLISV
jgi:hypothetical protein